MSRFCWDRTDLLPPPLDCCDNIVNEWCYRHPAMWWLYEMLSESHNGLVRFMTIINQCYIRNNLIFWFAVIFWLVWHISLYFCVWGGGGGSYDQLLELDQAILNTVPSILLKLLEMASKSNNKDKLRNFCVKVIVLYFKLESVVGDTRIVYTYKQTITYI